MDLKELIIIVRPEKAQRTEQALFSHGARYVTRQTVSGRGKEMGLSFRPGWLFYKSRLHPYLHKVLLSAFVEKQNLSKIIQAVINKNRTGKYGDGRIFVLPAEESNGSKPVMGGKNDENDTRDYPLRSGRKSHRIP